MEIVYTSIVILGTMVLVLALMVGWVYLQQTRLSQTLNSIVLVIGEIADRRHEPTHVEMLPEPEVPHVFVVAESEILLEEEDDRVKVEIEEDEVKLTPEEPPFDTDGLETKTRKDLMAILVTRGIPFGKGDTKNTLVSLLKATS